MRLAREGMREIILATVVCALLEGVVLTAGLMYDKVILVGLAPIWLVWLLAIAFFRDPHRNVPGDPGLLVSPADGTVTDVARLGRYEGIRGPALRIGMFLSVFDVHINRVPCAGRVREIRYRPGQFLDARHDDCGAMNEANDVILDPTDGTPGPVVVRQIAGKIARRIVCNLVEGQVVTRGQRLGLIKFGSRTELILPAQAGVEAAVGVNDKVRGGESVLVRVSRGAMGVAGPSAERRASAVGPVGG